MKTIVVAAIMALGAAAGAVGSGAQAETVWHFPYKGVPYATQTTPAISLYRARHHARRCRYFRHSTRERCLMRAHH